ncbi:hypothetical protein J7K28_07310 [Candidatus Aerophobetes bacterium]|nr:hypothetical protein [Candidatus Aerophobetes bacterium]
MSIITQGILIIAGILALGSFLTWLGFRIKSLKAIPFVIGILLLMWGIYLIFDFISVVL